ncbi:MAG: class I SAM-dependent methyltransferase [Gammaproteobacteria bacterium]
MHPEQAKWDERYRNANTTGKPAGVLQHYQHLLPETGSALDLACGLGGNALLLAQHGLDTYAWDISPVALQTLAEQALHSGLFLQTEVRDIAAQPPEPERFDVIVVSYFLERPLFPALINALRPNGLIFYQTFTQKHFSDSGPGKPDYRLQANELLQLLNGLRVMEYHECDLPWLKEPVDEACAVACK